MAETNNPDAPIVAPRFAEEPEGRAARREHGKTAFQGGPGRLVQFLHDVRAEMKPVSWPNAKHVQHTTIITLIAVVFFAVYLFVVDLGLSRLIVGIEWLVAKIARLLGLA
jgi:preprotein translocase subunit SecE